MFGFDCGEVAAFGPEAQIDTELGAGVGDVPDEVEGFPAHGVRVHEIEKRRLEVRVGNDEAGIRDPSVRRRDAGGPAAADEDSFDWCPEPDLAA